MPNTPGAGQGKDYTPVIDMTGVDTAQHQKDQDECRKLAAQVDVQKQTFSAALGGALVGALLGAAFGGGRQVRNDAALAGSLGASGAATASGLTHQRQIMLRCMNGRGYKVVG